MDASTAAVRPPDYRHPATKAARARASVPTVNIRPADRVNLDRDPAVIPRRWPIRIPVTQVAAPKAMRAKASTSRPPWRGHSLRSTMATVTVTANPDRFQASWVRSAPSADPLSRRRFSGSTSKVRARATSGR